MKCTICNIYQLYNYYFQIFLINIFYMILQIDNLWDIISQICGTSYHIPAILKLCVKMVNSAISNLARSRMRKQYVISPKNVTTSMSRNSSKLASCTLDNTYCIVTSSSIDPISIFNSLQLAPTRQTFISNNLKKMLKEHGKKLVILLMQKVPIYKWIRHLTGNLRVLTN